MSKNTSKGVYQLENGFWGFRYTYTIDGKKKELKEQKTNAAIRSRQRKQQSKHARRQCSATNSQYRKNKNRSG